MAAHDIRHNIWMARHFKRMYWKTGKRYYLGYAKNRIKMARRWKNLD